MMNERFAPGTGPLITAVLGPTNTGKTHLAMERMLGHETGMIGFPLRLLARENYDRAVRAVGARHVALITGEEKIIPPEARWFLCTVEAMPVDRHVAFLGVDEIQLCADPDRGHVFTDRLLHARGRVETMFMGAETIRPLLRRLVPDARVETRERLSTLSYAGPRKLQRLPPRTAVVTFSSGDVYAMAEIVRRQRGGAAIVLGALSPRTRNAQVEMYQAGEVDYLVATDAIGMGLNMDINHVAFAATRKFDGRVIRELQPAELAQIAGRAGRNSNDGTFGTTADIGPLDPDVVEGIENHRFDPLIHLCWRHTDLNFTSLDALKGSLARRPKRPGLVRAREADDEEALAALSRDPDIVRRCASPALVRLLWDVCQIPDFRKVMSDAHAQLLTQVFGHLAGGAEYGDGGRLPADWVAHAVDRLDRTDGDIDTLTQRIAHVRTWTYISYHSQWLEDAPHWQARTRAIEDKLSDALHERLIQRFVDRRTAVLVGHIHRRQALSGAVSPAGDVHVEGEFVGTLEGFRFIPDAGSADQTRAGDVRASTRIANTAALRALRSEMPARIRQLEADDDASFTLGDDCRVSWNGHPIARLVAGQDRLRPRIEADGSDLLEGEFRDRIRRRVAAWLSGHLETKLEPLFRARAANLEGAARGVAFQVVEALGSLPRSHAKDELAALNESDRRALTSLGLRLGRETLYFPRLVKPDAVALRRLLWGLYHGVAMPALPHPGRVSIVLPADWNGNGISELYEAVGYRRLGRMAIRVDIVERFSAQVRQLAEAGEFPVTPDLASTIGCAPAALAGVLADLGYLSRAAPDATGLLARRKTRAKRRSVNPSKWTRRDAAQAHSPFAKLKALAVPE